MPPPAPGSTKSSSILDPAQEPSPYGSFAPSRDVSPNRAVFDSHRLRHVSGLAGASSSSSPYEAPAPSQSHSTLRKELSKLSKASRASKKASSRKSEDLDGAVLVSGMDGRFGVSDAGLSSATIFANDEQEDDGADDSQDEISLTSEDFISLNSRDDYEDGSERNTEDNSPHAVVRASVPPTDNTTLSINTPRMWTLSVLFSILGSSTNLFFSLRYPSVAITPVVALLLVHPLGLLWDSLLKRSDDPNEDFIDGFKVPNNPELVHGSRQAKLRSWRLWLAQGKWNEKEHTCVYVSSNVAFGFAFATDVIVEQTQFYSQSAPIMYQLLLTISTQVLGYGFAGLTRRFLVYPSSMIWPGTLMSAAMFSTLHKQENKPANGWTISRWKFFLIVWAGSFLLYFLPGLLMPALSYFSVITWFAPKSVVIANLFGVSSGLGLFPVTFDWAQITYVGSPLLVPFWAAMNVIGGLTIIVWIIAPIFYYSNIHYSSYMPILSTSVFDNTGKVYDVSRILTSNFLFDLEAYKNYSLVFLPATYILSYGVQFAGLAALLTHTACWHGKEIWQTAKSAFNDSRGVDKSAYQPVFNMLNRSESSNLAEERSPRHSTRSRSTSHGEESLLAGEDIHNRLMRRYKDAPLMWYLITFLSMTTVAIFTVE